MWRHSVTLVTLALDRARHAQFRDRVIHTCIISTTVLHTMKAKMRYSNACDVTTRHIWNWRRLSGMYLFNGLAFRANSMHWRWKHYSEKTIKSYLCGRGFDRYHTAMQSPTKGETLVWLGWPRQNSHLVSSWRRKNGVLNSYFCRFLTTRHFRNAKETGTS